MNDCLAPWVLDVRLEGNPVLYSVHSPGLGFQFCNACCDNAFTRVRLCCVWEKKGIQPQFGLMLCKDEKVKATVQSLSSPRLSSPRLASQGLPLILVAGQVELFFIYLFISPVVPHL